MKNQVLSIKQMQELIDIGVNTSNASIWWIKSIEDSFEPKLTLYTQLKHVHHLIGDIIIKGYELIPTFTLQDIIDILPGSIEEDIRGRFDYELRIKKDGVAYESFDALDSKSEPYVFDEYYIDGEQYKTVLDCAFEMLKSLNNLKKL